MQFARISLFAALTALVNGQTGSIAGDIAALPACALTCLITADATSGCGPTDYVCQCTTGHDAILASAAPCLQSACSANDVLTTTSLTNEICMLALAQASSSVAPAATSAVMSATMAASSVASSIVSSKAASSMSVVSSISSSMMAMSSTTAMSSTMASSMVSTKASTTAAAAATTTNASSMASMASTSKATASAIATAGASRMQVGAGVLGAAVMVAMAL